MSPSPALAVITVSYRSEAVLPALVASLAKATKRPYAAIVADNAPDDRMLPLAAELGAGYLAIGHNAGYGGAVNAAARTLEPEVEWILVCNPDVRLLPDSLDLLVDRLEADSTIGTAGPRVLNEDGTTYPSARALPSLRTGIGHALFANIWKENPWTRQYRSVAPSPSDEPRIAGWLSGSCLLIRRAAFDAVGGFDEGYFMYFEDVDLGMRMTQAGYRNVYIPKAHVVHTGAHSTSTEAPRMIAAHHMSARRFISRRYPGPLFLPVRWAIYVALDIRSRLLQLKAGGRQSRIERMPVHRRSRSTRE